jgi:hypothetical protein
VTKPFQLTGRSEIFNDTVLKKYNYLREWMISERKEEEKEENEWYKQNRKTFKHIIMAFITKFILVKKRFIGVLTYVWNCSTLHNSFIHTFSTVPSFPFSECSLLYFLMTIYKNVSYFSCICFLSDDGPWRAETCKK